MSQCHDVYDFEEYETGQGRFVEGTQCHDIEEAFGQSEPEPASQARTEDQEPIDAASIAG